MLDEYDREFSDGLRQIGLGLLLGLVGFGISCLILLFAKKTEYIQGVFLGAALAYILYCVIYDNMAVISPIFGIIFTIIFTLITAYVAVSGIIALWGNEFDLESTSFTLMAPATLICVLTFFLFLLDDTCTDKIFEDSRWLFVPIATIIGTIITFTSAEKVLIALIIVSAIVFWFELGYIITERIPYGFERNECMADNHFLVAAIICPLPHLFEIFEYIGGKIKKSLPKKSSYDDGGYSSSSSSSSSYSSSSSSTDDDIYLERVARSVADSHEYHQLPAGVYIKRISVSVYNNTLSLTLYYELSGNHSTSYRQYYLNNYVDSMCSKIQSKAGMGFSVRCNYEAD